MSIPTPTSDPAASAASYDVAALATLANDFFAQLPNGQAPVAAISASEPVLALGNRAPSLAPAAQTQTGVPDKADGAGLGRGNGLAQGVPEAYAALLPQVDLPAPPAQAASLPSGSPYYFLGKSSAYPSSGVNVLSEDRVTARSFGLPGEDDLRVLLAQSAPREQVPQAEKKILGSIFQT